MERPDNWRNRKFFLIRWTFGRIPPGTDGPDLLTERIYRQALRSLGQEASLGGQAAASFPLKQEN
jgi:hypothetical protein